METKKLSSAPLKTQHHRQTHPPTATPFKRSLGASTVSQMGPHPHCLPLPPPCYPPAARLRPRAPTQTADMQRVTTQRQVAVPQAWQGVPALEANHRVIGSWSTKVTALIKYLKYLDFHEHQPKSLVYTQWGYVRNVIADALRANGISYAHTARAKTELDRFKNDPSVQVGASWHQSVSTRTLALALPCTLPSPAPHPHPNPGYTSQTPQQQLLSNVCILSCAAFPCKSCAHFCVASAHAVITHYLNSSPYGYQS